MAARIHGADVHFRIVIFYTLCLLLSLSHTGSTMALAEQLRGTSVRVAEGAASKVVAMCDFTIEMEVKCKHHCSISLQDPPRLMEFGIEVRTEIAELWTLTDVAVAYESATFQSRPMSILNQRQRQQLLVPKAPVSLKWANFWDPELKILTSAVATSRKGKACRLEAVYEHEATTPGHLRKAKTEAITKNSIATSTPPSDDSKVHSSLRLGQLPQ